MHCLDIVNDLPLNDPTECIRILTKERNDFAKSRELWISAAFGCKVGDMSLFDELVKKELCHNCVEHYES